MAFSEYDDDGPVTRGCPAPDDRTWRHPAEVAASQRMARRRSTRRSWGVGATTAVTGALIVATAWYFSDTDSTTRAVAQRASTTPVALTSAEGSAQPESASLASESARRATLTVTTPDGQPLAGAVTVHSGGYALTSARSLGANTELLIVDSNGTSTAATEIGRDLDTDIAVLKTDARLSHANMADTAKVGDVVAVIDPTGSTHRQAVAHAATVAVTTDDEQLIGVHTLDSTRGELLAGSPVIDSSGAITGIVASTPPDQKTAVIPIAAADRVASSIVEHGEVHKAWLGVSVGSVKDADGVVVTAMVDDGPAQRAGLLVDDHIVGVGTADVDSTSAIVAALRTHPPGADATVTVVRDGVVLTIDVVLGRWLDAD